MRVVGIMPLTEAEAAILRAEVVALQAVMMSVFRRMAEDKEELTTLFCQAFDEAETILSGVAVKMGLDAPSETTIGALEIVEQFRAAIIRDERRCS